MQALEMFGLRGLSSRGIARRFPFAFIIDSGFLRSCKASPKRSCICYEIYELNSVQYIEVGLTYCHLLNLFISDVEFQAACQSRIQRIHLEYLRLGQQKHLILDMLVLGTEECECLKPREATWHFLARMCNTPTPRPRRQLTVHVLWFSFFQMRGSWVV